MLKILGGDWPANNYAAVRFALGGLSRKVGLLVLTRGVLKKDSFPPSEIVSVDLVTQENQHSVAAKLGWGTVGGLALGPVGLLAGVLAGGNRNMMLVAVGFKDGRKVLLEGKSSEVKPLLGLGFHGGNA